ncbi:MAG: NADH-quinone oxidoreductase subunit L [Dehalococcoidia bacterium]
MLGTVPDAAVWAIFFLPLISLITIFFAFQKSDKAGYVSAAFIGATFLLCLWCLDTALQEHGHAIGIGGREWLHVGNVEIFVTPRIDGLSAIMLVVATSVSFLVQIYSMGYMKGDPGEWRYFAYMSLFTMSMIGLVMFDSLLLIYVFWEMVGLSSYLLIGFWFNRPAAAAAAKKAFLVTRLGDIGFLLAILLIYTEGGTFNIPEIQELALTGAIGGTTLTLFALGLFAGAAGKSAQVPLHVWLPDAMEGPTPVSALIHAATMVAAGVYLVARMFPVFHESPDAMAVVGAIGGITAITAALTALVMTDIKRVLAYSTISQLGYMMLALGSGAYVAAIFHLFTHAFFKALLFLGSGSVNHSTNTFDMRLMGGLRKTMPVTFWTFLIGTISLMGLFPFAGFWSKDEILSDTYKHEPYLFWIALVTAGITAFYMARVIFMTFFGEYRGGAPAEAHGGGDAAHEDDAHGHGAAAHHGPHESPALMTLPLLVLAVPAIIAGFANFDKDLEHLLVGALPEGIEVEESVFRWNVAIVSTVIPLIGIALAYIIYQAKAIPASGLQKVFKPLHALLENRYYLDVLYEKVIVGTVFMKGLGGALTEIDRLVVDGAVNGVGRGMRQASARLKYVQSGQFQTYGAVGVAGLLVTAVVVLVLNPL